MAAHMSGMGPPPPPPSCPACGGSLPNAPRQCPSCHLHLLGEDAGRLWWIEQRLAALNDEQRHLRHLRSYHLQRLRDQTAARPPAHAARAHAPAPARVSADTSAPPADPALDGGSRHSSAPWTAPWPAPAAPVRGRELTANSVRNFLLVLGAVLLVVAAAVFTVVAWSDLSIAARGALLLAATALAAYLPRPLHRRGLGATAETVAVVAASLLAFDAFALWSLALSPLMPGTAYAAACCVVAALLLLGYSRIIPLRAPAPMALVLAQFAAPLAALATGDPWTWAGFAFAATAAGNLALLVGVPPLSAGLRRIALVCATAGGSLGALWACGWTVAAAWQPYSEDAAWAGARGALLFVAVGGVAVAAQAAGPPRALRLALAGAGAAGLIVAPAAATAATSRPDAAAFALAVPALLSAVAAASPLLRRLDRAQRAGMMLATATLGIGGAGLLLADRLLLLPWWPLHRAGGVWGTAAPPGMPMAGEALWYLPALLGVLAVAVAALRWGTSRASTWFGAGVCAFAATPWLLPALPVTYDAALAALVVSAGALVLLAAADTGARRHAALWPGFAVALIAVAWSSVTPVRTVLVLAALAVTLLVAAPLCARGTAPGQAAERRAAAALTLGAALAVGAVTLTGYAAALHLGAGGDPRWLPVAGVAVAALAGWAARLPGPSSRPEQRGALAAAALLLAVLGTVLGVAVGDGGAPTAGLAAVVAASVITALRGRGRLLPAAVAAGAGIAAAAGAAEAWAGAVFAPLLWVSAPWQGSATLSRAASEAVVVPVAGAGAEWQPAAAVLLVGAAAVLAAWGWAGRGPAALTASVAAVAAAGPLPTLLNLPTWASWTWLMLMAATLLGASRLASPTVARAAGVSALWATVTVVAWSLAEPPLTLAVLLLVVVLGMVRQLVEGDAAVVAGAAATAAAATGAFAVALLLALGQPPNLAALGLVAVVAAVAAVLGAVALPRPMLLSVEVCNGVLATAAVGLTLLTPGRPEFTSLALGALGVVALGGALRPGRRWYAALGGVLLLSAWWVLLAGWTLTAPEPYVLPPALAALAVGWEWRRRSRAAGAAIPGSWVALAPGVALGLLPSLTAVFLTESDALRLTLLVCAATGVVMVSALWRLQAPLLLGGGVLLVAAQRAFGEPLWQLIVAVPAWIPWAAAGLLLLVVGARFERSMHGLHRLGRILRSMD